ncbi:MAG: hypothetical protein SNJ55_05900 [Chloroherpetonaceae bacterium]
MIQSIQTGVKRAQTHWQISVLVYAANLVFALGFALAFKNLLADEFAFRDVSTRLLDGFDFTFLSDLNYASASIASLLKMLNWLVVGYVVMSVFLSGGIIASLLRERFSFPDFFADSARYVGRFIVLGLFFALTLLVPIVVVAIFSAIGNAQSESAISEVPMVIWTAAGVGIASIKLAFFYLVFEVAKFEVVCESLKPFQAFVSAFKIVLKNFAAFFGIVLVFLVFVGAIGGLLHVLAPKGETGVGVFMLVLMQQALVASRVFLRVATVGALLKTYQDVRAILNEQKRIEEQARIQQQEVLSETKRLEHEQAQAEQVPSEHIQTHVETPAIPQADSDEAAQKPKESKRVENEE